jgi:isopenicillin N synthase-like dioxygenase
MTAAQVPTIDIAPLLDPGATADQVERVAAEIAAACTDVGFLQIVGHGIDPGLRRRLHDAAAAFFAQPDEAKAAISMRHGGVAWRGWFPLGDELTAGVPDDKEGLYFGTELPADDPRVRAGVPLHGANLFPQDPAELRDVVLEWMDRVTLVGRAVLSGIAVSFGLDRDWFDRWCADPTVLFRIFHYPPPPPEFAGEWGVAEHTDYGLLTLLVQDDTGGLEVRVDGEWIEAPPTPDAIVCNLGDMLERVTGGRFRSTPHRVRPPTSDRYSFPLFLDPAWDAELTPLPGCEPTERALAEASRGRWDGASVFDVGGPYSEYLLSKVSKVFPDLFAQVVAAQATSGQGGEHPEPER